MLTSSNLHLAILRICIFLVKFIFGEIKTSISGFHLYSFDTVFVIDYFSLGRFNKSVIANFYWILFLLFSYFLTIQKDLSAIDWVIWFYLWKLGHHYNVTAKRETIFFNFLIFGFSLTCICFGMINEIIFLENHFLDMRRTLICVYALFRISLVKSLTFVVGTEGLFERQLLIVVHLILNNFKSFNSETLPKFIIHEFLSCIEFIQCSITLILKKVI